MTKEIEPINYEMIRRLRKEGRSYEANKMLRAYQDNLKESWKEGRKENHNINQKITAFKKRLNEKLKEKENESIKEE